MTDKIVAVIALLSMCAFVSIVFIWVPEPSLIAVCVVVMLMAAYDFYRMLFLNDKNKGD